jgi:hypothetical protein
MEKSGSLRTIERLALAPSRLVLDYELLEFQLARLPWRSASS